MACFANAAPHLEPGGCFAVEAMVSRFRRLKPGRSPFTSESTSHVSVWEKEAPHRERV